MKQLMTMGATEIPVINLTDSEAENALRIASACENHGFFCVSHHGVSTELQSELDRLSREFFELPLEEKMKIHMRLGGSAWRGFFPVGEELTSGQPDLKEGLYLGENLDDTDERVQANWPLHGKNLYPETIKNFNAVVENYMAAMTILAHRLMRLVSLSLNLEADYIFKKYTSKPTPLFRIFHYPPAQDSGAWGVGEHTDYGLLTILKQDDCGGLEVKTNAGWVSVPPVENVFVCNIGDMLELLTKGKYVSTPHRVKNTSGRERLSFPFFFDPGFASEMNPLPLAHSTQHTERWDQQNLHKFEGTYRNYLLSKISKVFPQLAEQQLI